MYVKARGATDECAFLGCVLVMGCQHHPAPFRQFQSRAAGRYAHALQKLRETTTMGNNIQMYMCKSGLCRVSFLSGLGFLRCVGLATESESSVGTHPTIERERLP